MESLNKRVKLSPDEGDFISLNVDTDASQQFGYENDTSTKTPTETYNHALPAYQKHDRRVLQDRRHAKDRPKQKFILEGHSSWILVKTKYGRKFVHNVQTKESFWRIPPDLIHAVRQLELCEGGRKEKEENARWAEEQLQQMRGKQPEERNTVPPEREGVSRRRRSESLQREDEAALLAELNAENKALESQDLALGSQQAPVNGPQAGDRGYDSDGESFEYIEVTDSEDEGELGGEKESVNAANEVQQAHQDEPIQHVENGPVEFGEDDIAFQLAAMGEDYGLDPGEYGDDMNDEWEEGAEGLPLSEEDALNLFHDLLDDSGLGPFTPWESIITDSSPASILHDDRYTVLPNMKSRKAAWDSWTKLKIAKIRAERAQMEESDPRIAYLAFLDAKATPKLYWPEFKRKHKREPELVDRRMTDKEREKLYRDHVSRLKLPESTRKADLTSLLSSLPLRVLNRSTRIESLPSQLLTHVQFISLPASTREELMASYIRKLPGFESAEGEVTEESRDEQNKRRNARQRREAALAAREAIVAEDTR